MDVGSVGLDCRPPCMDSSSSNVVWIVSLYSVLTLVALLIILAACRTTALGALKHYQSPITKHAKAEPNVMLWIHPQRTLRDLCQSLRTTSISNNDRKSRTSVALRLLPGIASTIQNQKGAETKLLRTAAWWDQGSNHNSCKNQASDGFNSNSHNSLDRSLYCHSTA